MRTKRCDYYHAVLCHHILQNVWMPSLNKRPRLQTILCRSRLSRPLQNTPPTQSPSTPGWRTDNFNYASQKAIERLGAQKDGVICGHALRRDGTIRDTVMYSMRAGEWPEAKAQLAYQLDKPRS